MYNIAPKDKEVNRVLNWATEGEDAGSKFPGMSFESGVKAGIEWLIGHSQDAPDIE